jgi:hypothetical protein
LPKLKQFLDIEGKGAARILLIVPLEQAGAQGVVELPGRWNLSAQARNILRGHEGVTNIAEF